jgi:hypothetical protein
MLALNADKLQRMGLYASLIAVVGLGASIFSGNEDGFITRVPVVHQKALLLFASALAVRSLFIRVCDLGFRRSRRQAIGSPVCPDSLADPVGGEKPHEPTRGVDHTSRPAQEAH